MTIRSPLSPMLLAAALALGGCAVVPADDYGYYDDDRYYDREGSSDLFRAGKILKS